MTASDVLVVRRSESSSLHSLARVRAWEGMLDLPNVEHAAFAPQYVEEAAAMLALVARLQPDA